MPGEVALPSHSPPLGVSGSPRHSPSPGGVADDQKPEQDAASLLPEGSGQVPVRLPVRGVCAASSGNRPPGPQGMHLSWPMLSLYSVLGATR